MEHSFLIIQIQTPLSFEKRGCVKPFLLALFVDALKGYYNIVLNIRLKLQQKYTKSWSPSRDFPKE